MKIDEEGNVLGIRKGAKRDGEFVVVSAHMDTVFPAGSRRDTGNIHHPPKGENTGPPTVRAERWSSR